MAAKRIPAAQVSDVGVTVVADGGSSPVADIIFVHGIQGHPYLTWTFKQKPSEISSNDRNLNPRPNPIRNIFRRRSPAPEPSPAEPVNATSIQTTEEQDGSHGVFWPGDLLPNDQPSVRILTCGYDSHVSRFFKGPTSQMNIHDIARNLLNQIVDERVSCPDRPIIFVAHSLGGILVKELLRLSRDERALKRLQNPYNCTFAIIFFGTPHRGSDAASWGLLVSSVAKAAFFDVNKTILRDLDPSSNTGALALIGRDFIIMATEKNWETATFRESQAIEIPGFHKIIVPEASVVLDYAKDNLQTLPSNHMDMCRFSSRTDQKYKSFLAQLTHYLQELVKVQEQARAATIARLQTANTQKLQEITSWLSKYPHSTNFRNLLSKWFPGTCKSYLDSHTCVTWRNCTVPTTNLICQGNPGTGKSVLSAALVSSMMSQYRTSDFGLAYLFGTYMERKDVTSTSLLGSIARQLLERKPSVSKNIIDLHKSLEGKTPSHGEYVMMVQGLIRSFRVTFIFLDAIDEYFEDTRRDLLSSLDSLLPNVRIFITSRPDIEIRLRNATMTSFRGDINDFKSYLAYRIEKEDYIKRYTDENPELAVQVRDTIAEKADGMFLLVEHHFNALRGCISLKALRKAIEKVPATIEATWSQALERIAEQPPSYIELARKILMFLTFESNAWDVLSLRSALAVDLDSDEFDEEEQPPTSLLPFVCKGMVVLDSESQIIRLAHHSVQEYLLRQSALIFPNARIFIASTYLHFLSKGPNVIVSGTGIPNSISWESHPLAARSALLWGEHVRLSQIDKDFQNRILHYLEMEDVRKTFAAMVGVLLGLVPGDLRDLMPLHLASYHGLTKIVQALLDSGASAGVKDSEGRTPVSWCAQRGFQDVLDILLKSPVLGDEGSGSALADKVDNDGKSPLMWACAYGHLEVAKTLMSRSDVDAKKEDSRGNTAFYYAASSGFADIVSLLLKFAGYDKDVFNRDGKTALMEAAERGALGVVDVLLETSANAALRNITGMTALHLAAEHGHVPVIKRLISAAGGINELDNSGRTALIHAAEKGEAGAVECLVQSGADLNIQDFWKFTALHVAVISGHTNVVAALLAPDLNQILSLNRGLSISSQLGESHTPWFRLDPNIKDAQGCAALHLAAEFGKAEITNFLLRHLETEVNALDEDGRTPVARAAENAHFPVLNMLIQARCKPYDTLGKSLTIQGQWKEETAIHTSTIHRMRHDDDPLDPDETIISRHGIYETVEKVKRFREDGQPWPSVWVLVGPAALNLEPGWKKQRRKVEWHALATEWEWEYTYVNDNSGETSDRRPPRHDAETGDETDVPPLPKQHSNPRGDPMIKYPSSFSTTEFDDRPIDKHGQSLARAREAQNWMDMLYREQQRSDQRGKERESETVGTPVAGGTA